MGTGTVTLWVLAVIGGVAVVRLLWGLVSPKVRESPRRDGEAFRGLDAMDRARALAGHLNAPLISGNRIELLLNGDQIFPALMGAIRGARETLNFLTFVYWQGEIARETAAALAAAARRGVEVRVLLDDYGSIQMDKSLVEQMEEAGCRVCYFNPLRWYTISRYNYRTHRKILVADGRVGFTGGVGIADEWTGDAEDSDHWRDDHFRVQGPAVHHLQGAFAQNWRSGTGEVLAGPRFFPPLEPAGASAVMPILGEPMRASDVELGYWLSLAAARERIEIATPYFVPRPGLLRTFADTARRGVAVRLLVPGAHNDSSFVRRVSRIFYRPLLEAGVRIFEYHPTMMHAKAISADDDWAVIGSANFDNRSFELNYESNLVVVDGGLTKSLRAAFESDLERAEEVTLERLEREAAWKQWLGKLLVVVRDQL